MIILSKKRNFKFLIKEGMRLVQILKKAAEDNAAYALLLDDIEKTKYDLNLAYANFENVVEPDLIDSYIYQVNAIHMRYKFLLSRAKQLEDFHSKKPERV